MHRPLEATFLQLVEEAAARAYNRKSVFRQFLRRCGVPSEILSACSEGETKRAWLGRVLPELEQTERGRLVILNLADALLKQTSFPDLTGWEDSEARISAAKGAVEALREYRRNESLSRDEERDKARRRSKAEQARTLTISRRHTLVNLRERLDQLALRVGDQTAGYEFQDWFYDLADFAEVDARRPYVAAGRQIDGTLTVDGTTYLVELRFRQHPTGGPDIDGLLTKVNSKADNTMGLFVSISGYNDGAIHTASYARTPLLLVDFTHVYHVLSGSITLDELIRRVRRHASQTGEAFLALNRFGGP